MADKNEGERREESKTAEGKEDYVFVCSDVLYPSARPLSTEQLRRC